LQSDAFDNIGDFTFIMSANFIVLVFDLGMSFRKVKSGNLSSKLHRNPDLQLMLYFG